nr:2Fe-2S iron-sulfur cluster-binding protein [Bacilli bacterium]
MRKIKVLTENETKEIAVAKGTNLLEALRKAGFVLPADCGGKRTCRKCQVILNSQNVLACQTLVEEDAVVELTPMSIEKGYDFIKQIEIDLNHAYGIACDIGTTSIACYLVDLDTYAICDYFTDFNHQVAFGADVITRIDQCRLGNLPILHHTIINQLVRVVEYFLSKHNLTEIKRMYVSCNTTMAHLLAGIDPSPIGQAPFTPVFTNTFLLENTKLNAYITNIVILPSVGAYLGSDI